jgi:hypothetical protein
VDIFLDESGYTRDNLIDQHHPFLCVSTLRMAEDQCRSLKQQFFRRVQAPVLKHKILAKTPRNQSLVLDFLAHLAAQPQVVKSYLVHKRFALACKFVDLLIEPQAHVSGLNLYEGGQALAVSCGVYYTLAAMAGAAGTSPVLQAFHDLLRERTPQAAQTLLRLLEQAVELRAGGQLFAPAVLLLRDPEFPTYLAVLPDRMFDLSFTCGLVLLSGWRHDLGASEPVHLVHDTSSVMAKESTWWEYLTADDRSSFSGYGAVPLVFPVSIDSTEFGREEQFVGLQLVDVVAGAITRAFTWLDKGRLAEDDYGRRLAGFFTDHIKQFIFASMLPARDIAAIAHESAGSDAAPALAYIEEHLAAHAGIPR